MRFILPIILTSTILSFQACNTDFGDNQKEIHQMEDSLFAAFPTVNRVSIKVNSDFSKEISVTLGDKELYAASEAEQNKVVERTAEITKAIFQERMPKKGEVIFVENERTITDTPESEKKYPLILE